MAALLLHLTAMENPQAINQIIKKPAMNNAEIADKFLISFKN